MVLSQNRYVDPWNQIESPEINPCTCGRLIYKEARKYSGEMRVTSISGVGKTRQLHEKE